MFYGAFDVDTTVAEVCSDPQDQRSRVTVAPFTLMKSMRVVDLSDIPAVPSIFDPRSSRHRPALIFLKSFMQDFCASVTKDGREHVEYVPTQIVTEYIRQVFRDKKERGVQGIIYPSAVAKGRACVLFVEEAVSGGLNENSADRWLELRSCNVKTLKVPRRFLTHRA